MKGLPFQYSCLLILILFVQAGRAQTRLIVNLNNDWQFRKDVHVSGSAAKWEYVHLPHTWNVADVMDDEPGYYRGVGWYKKNITVTTADKNKQLYLHFEGANQFTEVYINGKLAGSHTGGYTAFQFPINSFLHFDGLKSSNEVLVKVDNSFNPQVPPLTADFTFFGGIYRDVSLIKTSPVHFDLNNNGSNGLFISTPVVNDEKTSVHISGSVINSKNELQNVKIESIIFDKQGKEIAQAQTALHINANGVANFTSDINSIFNPHLWSPDDPYLYSVKTIITETTTGKQLDEVINPLGFRWFKFDADKGFFLNGKSLKLIGASRHQDREGLGNAVSNELAINDILLLKKMGGNFLRVAHYPQDPAVMEACDKMGILASVEIPIVNEITEADSFYNRCDTMLVEMIHQNYNHPSVIVWCYMNEVLLRPHFNDDKERQKLYFASVTKLAKRLDSICRKEDSSRYTMIANHGDFDRYNNTGLTAISMIVGWNLYSGWYGGQLENFPTFLDKHHQLLPAKPMVVSEYGADADPRIRSFHPVKFDKSVEYSMSFHQYYLQEMMKRPFVSAAMIWNLADFNSETREETMPHINNKGLLMWNRTPKDLYYFYKAMLTKDPFVIITSSYWNNRTGIADSIKNVCQQQLQVATNLDSLLLTVNGKQHGWKKTIRGLCEWIIPFTNGTNSIEAKGIKNGKLYTDKSVIQFQLQPYYLNDKGTVFQEINILLGGDRYFFNEKEKKTWIPDQLYRKGSWGHMDGKPFKIANNTRLPYGTDKNILGTNNDPVYQTQLTGITNYKIDVPNGSYELILHFAELQGGVGKNLVYNFSDSAQKEEAPHRRFNVIVNGKVVLENFDIAAQYGIATAVAKKFNIEIKNNEGLKIEFKSLEGEAVLNALQLKKIK